MADLKRELDEITRAKDSLERLSYQLIDAVRLTNSQDLPRQPSDMADYLSMNQAADPPPKP